MYHPRTILALILLASGAIAARNTQGYVSALRSYDETLATNAQYISAVHALESLGPSYLASLQAQATATGGQVNILTALPPQDAAILSSVENAERSIAAQYGFLPTTVAPISGTVPAISSPTAAGSAATDSSVSDTTDTGSVTSATSSGTLAAGTTPTGVATSSTGSSTMTSSSKAMAAATGMPLVAGIAAVIGGLAIGL